MILNIITPCTRINNLKKLEDSIYSITNMVVKWHICFDTDTIPTITPILIDHKLYCTKSNGYERSGNKQRNLILNNINDGFIFFLDDDNIIHPNLNKILSDVTYGENYIFTQIFKNGVIRLKPHNNCIYPGRIDSAQILVSSMYLNEKTIWPLTVYLAEAFFVKTINNIHPFVYINEIGSFYNYLR